MTKKILLAAAAASAMAFAGAASAHTLTFDTTASATDIDAGNVGGATGNYKLAVEAANITPAFGTFALIDSLSTGASLPSGNVLLTVTLTGGTYGTAIGGANVTAGAGCTTFTATPSSGGAAGSTSATFLISNSSAGCSTFLLSLPVAPNPGVPVTVTTELKTEAGTPIDGLVASRTILTRPSAFNAVIDGTIGAGALTDTFATLTVTPVYTTFKVGGAGHAGGETATAGQLGTVEILADTSAFSDLAKTPVAIADVLTATVTTTGSFSAFDGGGGSVLLGGVGPTTLTTTVATHSGATVTTNLVAAGAPGAVVTPEAFIVTRETVAVAIPSSTYAVSVGYTLLSPTYNQEGPFAGSFEPIGRDGTNVVVPWLNSTSVQTANGTTNIIRLGNVGTAAAGPVYAQILNSTGTPSTTQPVQIFPSIAIGGERVINTAALTAALGEFGRGDVQISVEAPASTITARRYATLANGSTTEVTNGTVASDQTPADPNDVP